MKTSHCLWILQAGWLVAAVAVKSKASLKLSPLESEKELDTELRGWCESTWANNAKWSTFCEERFGEAEKLSGDFGMELSTVKDMIAAKNMEFLDDPIKQLEYTQSPLAQQLNFQQVKLKEEFANARAVRYNWKVAMESIQNIDGVVTQVCNEHKNTTKELQEAFGKAAKFLQIRAAKAMSATKRPFEYVEHTDSSCDGTGGDLATDFQAKSPELCKNKCDEFGMDCGGFVFVISGYHKNTCTIRRGPVQNIAIYSNDDRSCYEKKKPDATDAAMKALEGRKKRIEIMKKYCEHTAKQQETAQALKAQIKERRANQTAKFEKDIKVIEARMAKFEEVCTSAANDAKAFATIATKEKDAYAGMVESVSKENAALLDQSHQKWMDWRDSIKQIYDVNKQICDARANRNFIRVISRQEQIAATNLEASPLAEKATAEKPPDVCPDSDTIDKELKDIEDKIKEVQSWSK
jgi:hypothetical protein